MTSRPSTAAPILAVLAVVLVILGAYVGGYSWLGDMSYWPVGDDDEKWVMVRQYEYDWQVSTFEPAARLEAFLRGMPVCAQSNETPLSPSFGLSE